MKFGYQRGFYNEHASEALVGALPLDQNSPKECPMGLYAEQLSGTAFTVPRLSNRRTWLYKIMPSSCHSEYKPLEGKAGQPFNGPVYADPNQIRWDPFAINLDVEQDWLQGIKVLARSGSPETRNGLAIAVYTCTRSMQRAFQNNDGSLLIVPQEGSLTIRTELGYLEASPLEIVVIPRGIKFSVNVSGPSRGYMLEIYAGHFELPDLGPIGANGLANPLHFEFPVASFESPSTVGTRPFELVTKFSNELFQCTLVPPLLDLTMPFN